MYTQIFLETNIKTKLVVCLLFACSPQNRERFCGWFFEGRKHNTGYRLRKNLDTSHMDVLVRKMN